MTWNERSECESMIFYDKVELISDFCAEYDLIMAWDIEKDKFKITDGYDVLYLTHDYILNKRIDGIKHHILTFTDKETPLFRGAFLLNRLEIFFCGIYNFAIVYYFNPRIAISVAAPTLNDINNSTTRPFSKTA